MGGVVHDHRPQQPSLVHGLHPLRGAVDAHDVGELQPQPLHRVGGPQGHVVVVAQDELDLRVFQQGALREGGGLVPVPVGDAALHPLQGDSGLPEGLDRDLGADDGVLVAALSLQHHVLEDAVPVPVQGGGVALPEVQHDLGLELGHIGINCADEAEAAKTAEMLGALLSMAVKPGNSSIFVGNKEFEIMKKPGRGTHGHIAVKCNNVDRAIFHLGQRGVKFDLDSKVVKNGKTTAVYMADEIAGFAIHLVQK